MASITIRAKLVLPVSSPPLVDACVTVEHGRIVAVQGAAGLRIDMDLGHAVLMPGLVNAHTHLEFSQLERPLGREGNRFAEWIADVARGRLNEQHPETLAARRTSAVKQGLAELFNLGTAVCGEIAQPGFDSSPFQIRKLAGVVFLELLGLAPERQQVLVEQAKAHLESLASAGTNWRVGLSPHAPYTVTPELVGQVASLSADSQTPVAMHLAESFEELELLASGSGPLVDFLMSIDRWPGTVPRGIRPLDYLELLSTAARALVIHGNYLSSEEIAFLGAHAESMSVVYCPRTQAYFDHGPYPLAEMLRAGVNVALGTDSRASNPDLSLWNEMRYLVNRGLATPEQTLRMGTLNGAQALGMAAELGSIEPGKRAVFAVMPLDDATTSDRLGAIFARGTGMSPRVVIF